MKNGAAKNIIRSFRFLAPVADVLFSPFTLMATIWFRVARFWGVKKMPLTKQIFLKGGMFPIVDHYYEPLFDHRKLPKETPVSHLNFNDKVALDFIGQLNYGDELKSFPQQKGAGSYYYENGSFGTGDGELYYSIIRKLKPKRILEVGSGFSTLCCLEAVKKNKEEDSTYSPNLVCIEPYEMPFLEQLDIKLIREKVELVDSKVFKDLSAGDILFIDSSHMIRPGGDVNYLFLKILPVLAPGVLVHFHDIFLPYEYPVEWLRDEFRMWNEQYLLEAFLLGNDQYEVLLAINYMKHKYPQEINRAFPVMATQPGREPGSFWIKKR